MDILKNNIRCINLTIKLVHEWLGNEKVDYGKKEKKDQVGTVTGLAYTSFGGDILQIEATRFTGKGRLVLTGQLGDVMKESASIALDYVRTHANEFKIDPKLFEENDVHIHVPEGAVPKDGPSAGVTMTTALVSCFSNIPVKANLAMTGEVTLRGNVLPIGGLKEKSLAAHRSGIDTILIPKENVKVLKESFAYHYRNEAETKGRLKYSVSEIKRMSQAADTEEVMYSSVFMEKEKRIPSFVKKTEKISAASKGTIIHKVFELLDFSKDYTMKSLNEDIERWISLGKLKKEYEKVIYRKEILALTRSELGKRMKEAAQKKLLYKERQFVTGIPFSDMNKDAKTDDFVVVQGIIDVFWLENDKIVLLDYKTDRVNAAKELIDRYSTQLKLYADALERIFSTDGKSIQADERLIYSFRLQQTIVTCREYKK